MAMINPVLALAVVAAVLVSGGCSHESSGPAEGIGIVADDRGIIRVPESSALRKRLAALFQALGVDGGIEVKNEILRNLQAIFSNTAWAAPYHGDVLKQTEISKTLWTHNLVPLDRCSCAACACLGTAHRSDHPQPGRDSAAGIWR